MNLRQLELFVAVVEAGSFSRGAEAALLTQSTVSQHIAALESEVELQLLDRTGQGIEVTHAGKLFLQHARKVLAELVALQQAMAGFRGLRQTCLTIGASNIPKDLQELTDRNDNITNAQSGLDFFVIINDNML